MVKHTFWSYSIFKDAEIGKEPEELYIQKRPTNKNRCVLHVPLMQATQFTCKTLEYFPYLFPLVHHIHENISQVDVICVFTKKETIS